MWRFSLTPEDREKYGGPEWVEFALEKAVDLEVELLEQIEDATGYTILITLPEAMGKGQLKAVRAAVWLARHIAGIHEPPFRDFHPKIMAAKTEWLPDGWELDDAVPPEEPPNRAARRTTRKPTAPRSGNSSPKTGRASRTSSTSPPSTSDE